MMIHKVPGVRLLRISVFFATLLLSFIAKSQHPYISFQHLSNIDGLSRNLVLAITQDRQGFMWFGTNEGLNKFDGYEFTVFSHSKKDSTSISDDFVSSLLEDKQGILWIGTGAGLNRYNRATNSFISYLHNESDRNSINTGPITRMIESEDGNLWLGFASGHVDYFNKVTGIASHYQVNTTGADINALQLDKQGNLWIGTWEELMVMNKERQITDRFLHRPSDPGSLSNSRVNDIFQDHNGLLFIATENGLNQYDREHKKFIRYRHSDSDDNTLSANSIKCLSEDKEGRLWIGIVNGGIDVWDRVKNKMFRSVDTKLSGGINYNFSLSLFRDRYNNMWVGTNGIGIKFYDDHQEPFVIHQNIPGVATSLSNNRVAGLAEQPGKGIWIATDGGGLNFFDEGKDTFKSYRYNSNDPSGLPGDFVTDVLWDAHDQCLWISIWGAGLSRFDPATGKFKNFKHQDKDSSSIASDYLWRLYMDQKRVLYVGTLGKGLSIYDKLTSRFSNYAINRGRAEDHAVCMLNDSKGILWIGNWNGVTRINMATHEFVPLPSGVNIRSADFITEDSLGRVWISGSPGIQCYDSKNETTFSITSEDGLPKSNINAMLDDKRGNFWLSTNKGIVQFNVEKKHFVSFTIEDGLPTNQFLPRLLRASNGKMYFGSLNGLVVFHPDSIRQNKVPPEVVITDLKIFNKSVYAGGNDGVLKQSISETKEIWLPFKYNFITLNYTALNNTIYPRNQYAYRLKGLNEEWVYVDHQRSATFTSLDPGAYTFMVKASDNDGVWSDQHIDLIIHVLPPWWATYWFRFFAIAFVVIAAVLFYRYRLRSIRNQNTRLSALVEERTRKLKALNAKVVIQNTVLQERQEEIELQNEELKASQEEISAQRDVVMDQNLKLEEAQRTIEGQNEEIRLRNDNLELEVQLRTKELLEYNQQLEQFAFISAHNLRAPVARILGLGNILNFTVKEADENSVLYQKMVVTAHELDRVVKDLNTILEIRKNSTSFLLEINFAEKLERVKVYMEKEISDTGAEIVSDFSAGPMIRSVKPYVESILQNLVSNAIKYRHPDRKPIIKLTSKAAEEYVCLAISDNGLGIDTELFKDKIFKLYQRFHSHVEGKGLGLYLIKTQIEALGGKIELESKVNEGTEFRVYFKK